jgi:hypothetical protein
MNLENQIKSLFERWRLSGLIDYKRLNKIEDEIKGLVAFDSKLFEMNNEKVAILTDALDECIKQRAEERKQLRLLTEAEFAEVWAKYAVETRRKKGEATDGVLAVYGQSARDQAINDFRFFQKLGVSFVQSNSRERFLGEK